MPNTNAGLLLLLQPLPIVDRVQGCMMQLRGARECKHIAIQPGFTHSLVVPSQLSLMHVSRPSGTMQMRNR